MSKKNHFAIEDDSVSFKKDQVKGQEIISPNSHRSIHKLKPVASNTIESDFSPFLPTPKPEEGDKDPSESLDHSTLRPLTTGRDQSRIDKLKEWVSSSLEVS